MSISEFIRMDKIACVAQALLITCEQITAKMLTYAPKTNLTCEKNIIRFQRDPIVFFASPPFEQKNEPVDRSKKCLNWNFNFKWTKDFIDSR